MKRKIVALFGALVFVFSFGLMTSTPANADVLCWINIPKPNYNGASYHVYGFGASSCDTTKVYTQDILVAVKKWNGSDWVTVPGSSSQWVTNNGSYQAVSTGPAFCHTFTNRTYRVEMSHRYNNGNIHYHQGATEEYACNAW